jgi:enolase-phosphatase E1
MPTSETIVLDVEGTTTSIDFVHKELFPYSYEKMDDYLNDNKQNPELIKTLELVQSTALSENNLKIEQKDCGLLLKKWIKEDRKHPALKKIQGFIWQKGYESGEVKGHVYEDVPKCFKEWFSLGYKIGIYSSGSVLAQKLLFKYSVYGDLTPYLSFHFDTSVGSKRETQSYYNILESLNISSAYFLSDIKEELAAAKLAGFKVFQVTRENNLGDLNYVHLKQINELDKHL